MLVMLWRPFISNERMLQRNMKLLLQNVLNSWRRMDRLQCLRMNLPDYEQNYEERQRGPENTEIREEGEMSCLNVMRILGHN